MKQQNTARDFFLHLFSTVLLYMGVISLLALLFAIINKYVPDPLAFVDTYYYNEGIREQARFSIAMLLVVTPVYYWCMQFITKILKEDPELRDFKPRKWLMYLTIFAAAIIIVVTLIIVVWTFLNGEATTRFFLKVLAVLTVSLGMFWYYLNDAKGEHTDYNKYIAWASLGLVILTIGAGFFVMGTPAEQRSRRFDRERISDLQAIQWSVENAVSYGREIPQTLDSVTVMAEEKTDPLTGEQYTYRVEDDSVTLCATFATASDNTEQYRPVYPEEKQPIDWNYTPGENCFTFQPKRPVITNFQECVNAGFPVMESYPRQCSFGSQTFVEEISENL